MAVSAILAVLSIKQLKTMKRAIPEIGVAKTVQYEPGNGPFLQIRLKTV